MYLKNASNLKSIIKRFVNFMIIDNNWFIQESPGLNRDCLCVRRLFSMKKTKYIIK